LTISPGNGGRHAFLSHHLGELDHYEAFRAFVRDVDLYQQLFAVQPELFAHDMHPDYATTRYAEGRAGTAEIPLLAVQHHHAHMASCMAEHGLDEPVLGVSFDGTGYGSDGAVWGGEFLVGDYRSFRRAAHLRYVGMPGGDQTIREPWRMAVAQLRDTGLSPGGLLPCHQGEEGLSPMALQVVEQMLEHRLRTPPTSSAGRLFDAVAALAGVRCRVRYEGQAAIELEWLATGVRPDGSYPFDLTEGESSESPLVVDTRPLVRAVADDVRRGTDPARIGRRFHTTMVEVIAAVCGRVRRATGVAAVVLSGGVFLNALLTEEVMARLVADVFRVYRHRRVPPGDGGLSLGQLAVAAARARP
jgi:hydrogenase maturation protein HypF